MSDAPAPPTPTPAPAPPRRVVPRGAQVLIGFFGPGVLALALWFEAEWITRGMNVFARAAIDVLAVLLTLALWVGLFRLSGHLAWRGVRLGLFLLVGAGIVWIAGCFAIAHALLK